jgi:hypothetical protein
MSTIRFVTLKFVMDKLPCDCCQNGLVRAHVEGHLFGGGFRIHTVTNSKTGKELVPSEAQRQHIEKYALAEYENTVMELAERAA